MPVHTYVETDQRNSAVPLVVYIVGIFNLCGGDFVRTMMRLVTITF
jgi:hypothetical protein